MTTFDRINIQMNATTVNNFPIGINAIAQPRTSANTLVESNIILMGAANWRPPLRRLGQ
jgi:hypothetical protein